MTRRRLGALLLAGLAAACGRSGPGPTPTGATRIPYGDGEDLFGELTLPTGAARGPVPVVVVVHGGYWRAQYGLELGRPLAADLAARGVAAWNVEYRRVGAGGGWPTTLTDVAAAVDALAGPVAGAAPGRLDLADVRAVGHSAGGQLAAWAASRHRLPAGAPGADPAVRITRVVSQAGVLDLVAADRDGLGGGAAAALLGGSAAAVPDRYALASPAALLPCGVPVTCVHGDADDTVPLGHSRGYVDAARAAGDPSELVVVPGADHFAVIDPSTQAWARCVAALGLG